MKDLIPEENEIQPRNKDSSLRYSREHLIIAFAAGIFLGLGLAASRKLRDIASLAAMGARIYTNISHRGRRG
jgi:hypothetical protein